MLAQDGPARTRPVRSRRWSRHLDAATPNRLPLAYLSPSQAVLASEGLDATTWQELSRTDAVQEVIDQPGRRLGRHPRRRRAAVPFAVAVQRVQVDQPERAA